MPHPVDKSGKAQPQPAPGLYFNGNSLMLRKYTFAPSDLKENSPAGRKSSGPADCVPSHEMISFRRQFSPFTPIARKSRRSGRTRPLHKTRNESRALDAPSLSAVAEDRGFTFKGLFRQHIVVKRPSRDTAWFSWPDAPKTCVTGQSAF
jgi:hypothetical protein